MTTPDADTVQPNPLYPGTAAGEPEEYPPGTRVYHLAQVRPDAAVHGTAAVIGLADHPDEILVGGRRGGTGLAPALDSACTAAAGHDVTTTASLTGGAA